MKERDPQEGVSFVRMDKEGFSGTSSMRRSQHSVELGE